VARRDLRNGHEGGGGYRTEPLTPKEEALRSNTDCESALGILVGDGVVFVSEKKLTSSIPRAPPKRCTRSTPT
jgi:20S proteasome alpha/beta subunit